MRKRMGVLFGALVIASSIFFTRKEVHSAIVVPGGPPVQGSAIQGNCSDGQELRCSTYYGSPAAVNSGWVQENASGVGISNAINGAVTPANNLDVNGTMEVGGGASPAANKSVQVKITPLNASTTGQIVNSAASATADSLDIQNNGTNVLAVNTGSLGTSPAVVTVTLPNASSTGTIVNSAASPTADLQEWQVNGTTVARVGALGGIAPHIYPKATIDTLVPDFLGEMIVCANCAVAYTVCIASGTSAAQWTVPGSVASKGCGSNN